MRLGDLLPSRRRGGEHSTTATSETPMTVPTVPVIVPPETTKSRVLLKPKHVDVPQGGPPGGGPTKNPSESVSG